MNIQNIIDGGQKMDKKEYFTPEFDVILLSQRDVITESEVGGGIIITPDDEF